MTNPGQFSTRMVVYTDDVLISAGTVALLSSLPHMEVTNADPDLSSLLPLIENARPDIVVIDLNPHITMGLLSALREASPLTRIVLRGRSFSAELLHQGKELGVAGFVHRGCSREQFVESILEIAAKDAPGGDHAQAETTTCESLPESRVVRLTRREGQLVTLLAQGMRNKEIASCLDVSEGTVRIYLSNLFEKVGARDRFELAVFGLKNAYCGRATWDGENAFVTERDDARAKPVLRSLLLVEPQRRRGYAEPISATGGK